MTGMTGYGYAEMQDERLQCSVEVKSYNNRYLDFYISLPPFLSSLEPLMKQRLMETVRRGKIEVSLRIKELKEDAEVIVDQDILKEYHDRLKTAAARAGIKGRPDLALLMGMEGVVKTIRHRDPEDIWNRVSATFEKAVTDFFAARSLEGRNTARDILGFIQILENSLDDIKAHAGDIEEKIHIDLRSRLEQLLGPDHQIDEQRLLSELAFMLVKYSIHEELARLGDHLNAFREIAASPEPTGKKLDFLCQELNREINTIGSKSSMLDVSRSVVTMKDVLENIREQLRNVE